MGQPAPPIPENSSSSDSVSNPFGDLQYPLSLSFKLIALASQASVVDATGRTVLFTRQKMFKFKEHVEVWSDKSKGALVADIKANKVLDWSARYTFTDANGNEIGSVGRRGWQSIWKAHYESFEPGSEGVAYSIQEGSAWTKVMDSLFGQIPILGFFAGYFFHPSYIARDASGQALMTITKQPAFWEGKFKVEKHQDLSQAHESQLILSFMMLVLLERKRG
jgi:uncharacterized protein YxjI